MRGKLILRWIKEKFKLIFQNFFLLLTICTVVVCNFPFFFVASTNCDELCDTMELAGSEIAKVLHTSALLHTAHACSIAGALPMTVDVLMDYYLKIRATKKVASEWNERCLYVLALVLPSATFLLFSHSRIIPLVYIAQMYTKCCHCFCNLNISLVGI